VTEINWAGNYTYSADGRRDPFQNLLARGQEKGQPKNLRAGLAGISVDDVTRMLST